MLQDGIYRETVTPESDGCAGAPITLKNAPGARPVISACEVVAGPWTEEGERGVYRTAAPPAPLLGGNGGAEGDAASTGLDQIFINGQMQPEARFPNKTSPGQMTHDGMMISVASDFRITASALEGYPVDFFSGARFYGHVHPAWTAQNGAVVSSESGVLRVDPDRLSTPWWPNRARKSDAVDADADYKISASTGEGFLYGTRNLIDADGEWCLERGIETDTLYLRPPRGKDPSALEVERKVRPWVVDINGRDHWILSGLNFSGGAVRLRGAGLVLKDSELRYPSHFFTFKEGYGSNGGLANGTGVLVDGTGNVVSNCVIRQSAGSGVQLTGSGHRIVRSLIHDVDYTGTYGAGVALQGQGNRVEFCTIRDTGRDCIAISGGGHRLAFCDLSRSGRLAHDGGMVYTYGQNGADAAGRPTHIAYNWVHESGNPADLKNRGIYIDNYSRNFVIHHNVIWRIGEAGKNKGLHIGGPSQAIAFYHNTLIGCQPPTNATYTKYPVANRDPAFWTAMNNRVDFIYQNNLHIPAGTAPDSILENPSAADFRPRAGSPAIDPSPGKRIVHWETSDGKAGVPDGYILYRQDPDVLFQYHEINGQGIAIRGINDGFTGSTPDNGAYEFGGPGWRPGRNGYQLNCEALPRRDDRQMTP